MTDTTYNGWTNYQTWNVALYIQNEYNLYLESLRHTSYIEMIPFLQMMMGDKTPDGVRWDDIELDTNELDEMLNEDWFSPLFLYYENHDYFTHTFRNCYQRTPWVYQGKWCWLENGYWLRPD